MNRTLFTIILSASFLTPQFALSSEVVQQKLNTLINEVGYLCGNEPAEAKSQNLAQSATSKSDQLKQKKSELQSHISVIDGWDLVTTIEQAVLSNKSQSTTKITKLIYLLGAADPSYANPVLQKIYDQSKSIAATTLPKGTPVEIKKEALNSSRIDIITAVIDAIELSGTYSLNGVLNKEAASASPSSERAKLLLKNQKL
ncbi:MAG: hypothetical protein Q8R10_19950 [Pseudomonas sp.]|uniref:hypothetical protein n=1 Tax=Pseudomonas sp. TaxID=306 RepID=UPI0027342582|nr:hypothetical protein [Pseudomonas sp.]MDP3848698.1 hypothetical protein [Pseudomonas sp.]